jgi:hypothetical protein
LERYRGHRVSFSSFALPDSFSTTPEASSLVLMFCVPGLILSGNEGVGSRFFVLRSRTHFGRYRGRRDPFLYFAFPESFLTVPRASGPVFMFCAPGLVLGGTEGGGFRFMFFVFGPVLSGTRASGLVFIFYASKLV